MISLENRVWESNETREAENDAREQAESEQGATCADCGIEMGDCRCFDDLMREINAMAADERADESEMN